MMRTLFIIAFAVPAIYVGSYFLCVRVGVTIWFGGSHSSYPNYHWLSDATPYADTIFAPIHRLDREHWRPTKWQRPVTTAERLQILRCIEQQHLPELQFQ
jgi:hypothetical protein